jgi:hypothetical protein
VSVNPLLCAKCFKDRAAPVHDPDLPDFYDHEVVRVTVVDSHPDGSVLTNREFWKFVGIVVLMMAAFFGLRALQGG